VLNRVLTQCIIRINPIDRLGARFDNLKFVYTPANPFLTQSQHEHRTRELTHSVI